MAGMFGAPVGQSAEISDMATLAQTQGQEIKNAAGMQAMQEQQRLAQIMQGLSGRGTPVEMMEEASEQPGGYASLPLQTAEDVPVLV